MKAGQQYQFIPNLILFQANLTFIFLRMPWVISNSSKSLNIIPRDLSLPLRQADLLQEKLLNLLFRHIILPGPLSNLILTLSSYNKIFVFPLLSGFST